MMNFFKRDLPTKNKIKLYLIWEAQEGPDIFSKLDQTSLA